MLRRLRIVMSFCALLALIGPTWAQQKQADNIDDIVAKMVENQEDAKQLNTLVGQVFQKVIQKSQADPDAADQLLDQFEATLGKLEPTDKDAQQLLRKARLAVRVYRDHISLARTSVDELKQKLVDNPDDSQTLSLFGRKVQQDISSIARVKPVEAEEQMNSVRDFLASVSKEAKDEKTKQQIESTLKNLSRLDRTIASAKKLLELIGQDAAPLVAEAWANGDPLSPGDLKGKVVLLDFWAVWCGPCIATFPHLREWHEKSADQGLEIIGVTKYYNYAWNDEAGRASRSEQKVAPEDEQAMLMKFAEHHELKHRFAIMGDNSLSVYYGVTGIPQAVLIDQSGVVRLIRVGSGPQNAHDIEEMLTQLFEK